jgi:hypothetical protein
MDVKGTGITTIPEYIKKNYPEKFDEWYGKLPESSKTIFGNPIMAAAWYPLTEGLVIPTQVLGKIVFENAEQAAFQLGRYSSEVSLNGVYKIFLRVSSPLFVLSRASTILGSYYRPATIEVVEKQDTKAVLKISGFGGESYIVLHRIAGWIEKTIEITGFKDIKVNVEIISSEVTPHGFVTAEWTIKN